MKNIQPYIIAGMTILIVVLSFCINSMNSDIKIYKQEIELSKLKTDKKSVQKQTDSVISDISVKSTNTVKKSKSLIQKITHETPKIKDTTDIYMYQYISSFRPKTD